MTCRILSTTVLCVLFSMSTLAQRPGGGRPGGRPDGERPKIGVVFGEVEDFASGKPIEFATISILAFDEDKVITGGVTDGKGRFRITEIPVGRFRAQIGFMGYTSTTLPDIRLTRAAAWNKTWAPSALNPMSKPSRPPKSSNSAPPSR